jgi:hypothetical protein
METGESGLRSHLVPRLAGLVSRQRAGFAIIQHPWKEENIVLDCQMKIRTATLTNAQVCFNFSIFTITITIAKQLNWDHFGIETKITITNTYK